MSSARRAPVAGRLALGGDRTRFVGGVLAVQAARFVLAFLAARLLVPEEFASWNKLLLLVQYSTYASLGVTMAVNRDVPVLLARERDEEARRRVGASLAVLAVTTSAYVAVGVPQLDLEHLELYVAFGLLPLLTGLSLLNQAVLRSLGRFSAVGRGLVLEAAAYAAVVAPVLWWRQTTHFVIATDAVLVAVLAYYALRSRGWLVRRFSPADVRAAVASGIPLATAAGTYTLRQTADLLVALPVYGTAVFAGLAVSTVFLRALHLLPTVTNMLWLPDLGTAFGAGGPRRLHERTREIAATYVPVVAVAVVGLAVAAWVAASTVLGTYEQFRWLVTVKVAAEGATMLLGVSTMFLATLRRTRVVVAANLVALLPYALLLALDDPGLRALMAAIAGSAALYVVGVLGGYAFFARATAREGPA